jgi:hypothetical protein
MSLSLLKAISYYLKAAVVAVVSCFLIMSCAVPSLPVISPISVHAAEAGGGVAGFKGCNFDGKDAAQGQKVIQECLKQVFAFVFVLGLFVIAFRVALVALDNYNPFNNGKAIDKSINLVWEVTLGLILIGGPVIFVNTVNPAALNLDFLNLGKLAATNNPNSNTSGGSSGSTNPGGKGSSGGGVLPDTFLITKDPNGNNQTIKKGDIANADKVVSGGNKENTFNGQNLFANVFFSPIQAHAQEEMSVEQAETIIKTVLGLEVRCKNIFVTQDDLENCKKLESSFAEEINGISESSRRRYTPLEDAQKTFTGPLFTMKPIEVKNVSIAPNLNKRTGCQIHFAQVRVAESISGQRTLAIEVCNNSLAPNQVWKIENNQVSPKAGVIGAEQKILEDSTAIYLIS